MGLSGISTSELLVILIVALLVFGTGRLKTLGGDLGEAIGSFKAALNGTSPSEPDRGLPREAGDAASEPRRDRR